MTYTKDGNVRYRVQIRLSDHTDNAPCILWDRETYQLIQRPAEELKMAAIANSPTMRDPIEFLQLEGKKMVALVNVHRQYQVLPYSIQRMSIDNQDLKCFEDNFDLQATIEQSLLEDYKILSSQDEATPTARAEKMAVDADLDDKDNEPLQDDESTNQKGKKLMLHHDETTGSRKRRGGVLHIEEPED